MNLIDISIKKPLAVTMIFLAVIIFGYIGVANLPVDLFPNVTFPVMLVLTTYPGAGPEEIETMITNPLEKSLGTLNNLDKITSSTSENVSTITLQFTWGTNLDAASNDVRDRVGFILPYFPEDVNQPLLFKFDISQQPVVMYTIAGEIDPLALEEISNDIADRVQRVGGVAASYATGEILREIQIVIDPIKLRGTGITSDQILNVLQAQNVNYPLGNVESGTRTYIIRTVGEYKNLEDMKKTVIGSNNGVPILLGQVADVFSRASEITSIARTNGVPSVWGFVQKRTDANSVNVGNSVVKELEKIKKDLPPGVKIEIFFNQADYIMKSIRSTRDNLIMGAILAAIILFLFLASIRSTIFVSVSMPITIFFSLFLMYLFGMTINIISLGGLIIAIGMVVDAAIVVFEAIYRHQQEKKESPMQAASAGAHEVGMAITGSTLTTVAVFLPLLMVKGFASVFFNQLALTVTFALMSSLVVALTIIPMLCSRFLKVKTNTDEVLVARKFIKVYNWLEELYTKIITWALAHKKTVVFGTIGIFIVSLVLIPFIGTELTPDTDQGEINITAEMPVGTNLWATDSAIAKLEKILVGEIPEMRVLSTSIGSGSGFTALFMSTPGPHSSQIYVELVDRSERSRSLKKIQQDLRPKLNDIPGLKVRFTTEQFSELFFGGKAIEVKIEGYDLAKAKKVSEILMDTLKSVKGLVDIETDLTEGKPEFRLVIDRQKAANFGLTPYQIGTALRARIEGVVASQYRELGEEYDIKIMVDKEYRNSLREIQSMTITTPLGEVPIRNFIRDTVTTGPVSLKHENNYRVVTISGSVEGRDPGSVGRDVQNIVDAIPKPADFTVELKGGFEQQQSTFRDLGFIIILSLVLVYMIMVGQFESLREPFIIMFTVPLAVIGVLWMLFFTGTTLNMQSLLGVLILGGVVVNNAIVYIDYTNQLRRKEGMPLHEAVIEAGRVRLRPILMTALTTIFGLIPMALAIGSGNELRAPMARSLIGGLTVSTFLTLVFIPVIYVLFERKKEKNKPVK